MIRNVKQLKGFALHAADGAIGKVKDAYFDDSEWVVRYLVVETGSWLSGRSVLVSPLFITGVDWDAEAVEVRLTREQVKGSPDVDFDKPVSRQHEAAYFNYYRAVGYWSGPFVWGQLAYPGAARPGADTRGDMEQRMRRGDRNVEDAHLRSAVEVAGYQIQARDGGIGHVEDFLFDDESWAIEFVLVDTRNWLPGKHVMIPPHWIREVNWLQHTAEVSVTRETIKERPEYPEGLAAPEIRAERYEREHIGR